MLKAKIMDYNGCNWVTLGYILGILGYNMLYAIMGYNWTSADIIGWVNHEYPLLGWEQSQEHRSCLFFSRGKGAPTDIAGSMFHVKTRIKTLTFFSFEVVCREFRFSQTWFQIWDHSIYEGACDSVKICFIYHWNCCNPTALFVTTCFVGYTYRFFNHHYWKLCKYTLW